MWNKVLMQKIRKENFLKNKQRTKRFKVITYYSMGKDKGWEFRNPV